MRAQPVEQILLDKYPAFAGFGGRDFASFGTGLQRDRMQFDQFSGLF